MAARKNGLTGARGWIPPAVVALLAMASLAFAAPAAARSGTAAARSRCALQHNEPAVIELARRIARRLR